MIIQNGEVFKHDGKEYVITENNHQWETCYNNVRVSCYNIPVLICEYIKSKHIFYNQDAIAVRIEDMKKVEQFFNENNYEYKIEMCVKISDFEYKSKRHKTRTDQR